ncbi:MAG TPA: carboxypeptidase-like regulatory domain-containing protein [Planctomycetota bacterium]
MRLRNVVLAVALALALVAVPRVVAALRGEPEPAGTRQMVVPQAVSALQRAANDGGDAAREQVLGDDAVEADSVGVRVHVLTADGNPAAGATVRFWPRRSEAERERDDAWQARHDNDVEAALAKTGSALTTGADGTVRLDSRLLEQEQGSIVIARLGELYGESCVGPDETPGLVELQRDIGLAIEVVDTLGRPQPGLVVVLATEGVSLREGLQRHFLKLPETDSRGRVRLPHAQHFLGAPDAIEGRLRAFCQRRVSNDSDITIAEQSVPWNDLSAETAIRLVVPAGGAIAVRVTDADGRSMGAKVELRDDAGGKYESSLPWAGDRLCFRGLPPGRRWTVVASPRVVANVPDTVVAVTGPASADDVVEVDVTLPCRRWSFPVALVRSDGLPLRNLELTWICPELAIDAKDSCCDGRTARLDGMFPAHITRAQSMELRVDSPFVAAQVFRFQRTFAPGTNDLGEVVLSPSPQERVLASVEVRGDGAPLTGSALVWLATEAGYVDDIRRQRDGRMELLGAPPGEPMLLGVEHDGWFAERTPVALGEHRVVDLVRAAMLVVPFVPPEMPIDWIDAELRCLDRTGDPREATLCEYPCVFEWRALQPGRYSMQICAAGRVLHDEPELVLHAGTQHWPAERKRLDLRGRVQAFRIIARGPAPAHSLLPVEALCIPVNGSLPTGFDDARLPENCFLPPAEPFDLLVRASEFLPQRVRDPRRDVVIELQPMTRVDLESAGPERETIRVRMQVDAVRDPVLRAFDTGNHHEAESEQAVLHGERASLCLAPGTVIEVCLVGDGKTTPAQTVVVDTTSPQKVEVR